MEELNIAECVLVIPILYGFVFKDELQQGKFAKIIGVTFLSILVSARLDIQYFITNYPQRAIGILFAGMIIIFVYARHSNILKKIKRKIKKLNKMTLIYFNKLLDWLYKTETDKYIEKIEKQSLSFLLNNFTLLCLSILCLGHYTLKFLNFSFIIILFSLLLLVLLLRLDREITKNPFGMIIGFAIIDFALMPWIFHLLGATIKFSIFSSASLFFVFIFFAISSIFTIFALKKIIGLLRFLLVKSPIFYRQKRKAEIRQLNQQA